MVWHGRREFCPADMSSLWAHAWAGHDPDSLPAPDAPDLKVEIDNPRNVPYKGWVMVTLPTERVTELIGSYRVFVHGPTENDLSGVGWIGWSDAKVTELWLFGTWAKTTAGDGGFITRHIVRPYQTENDWLYSNLASGESSTFLVHPDMPAAGALEYFARIVNDAGQTLVEANRMDLWPEQCSKAAKVYKVSGRANGWRIEYKVTIPYFSAFAFFDGVAAWSDMSTTAVSTHCNYPRVTFPHAKRVKQGLVHLDQVGSAGQGEAEFRYPFSHTGDGQGIFFSGMLDYYALTAQFRGGDGWRHQVHGLLYSRAADAEPSDPWIGVWDGHLPVGLRIDHDITQSTRNALAWAANCASRQKVLSTDIPYGAKIPVYRTGGEDWEFGFAHSSLWDLRPQTFEALGHAARTHILRPYNKCGADGNWLDVANHPNLLIKDGLIYYVNGAYKWTWDFNNPNVYVWDLLGKPPSQGTDHSFTNWQGLDFLHGEIYWPQLLYLTTRSYGAEHCMWMIGQLNCLRVLPSSGSVRGWGRNLRVFMQICDCLPKFRAKAEADPRGVDWWIEYMDRRAHNELVGNTRQWHGEYTDGNTRPIDRSTESIKPLWLQIEYYGAMRLWVSAQATDPSVPNPANLAVPRDETEVDWQFGLLPMALLLMLRLFGKRGPSRFWDAAFDHARMLLNDMWFVDDFGVLDSDAWSSAPSDQDAVSRQAGTGLLTAVQFRLCPAVDLMDTFGPATAWSKHWMQYAGYGQGRVILSGIPLLIEGVLHHGQTLSLDERERLAALAALYDIVESPGRTDAFFWSMTSREIVAQVTAP